MKIFTVHIKPDAKAPYETAEFVKEGFSFNAFIFNLFWLLYHQQWLASLAVMLALAASVMGILMFGLHPLTQTAVQAAINLILGFEGNDLLRRKLRKRGYIVADVVTGMSELSAGQRFFERHIQAINTPAVVATA